MEESLAERILKKLTEHDNWFDLISTKLVEFEQRQDDHNKQFYNKLLENDRRMDDQKRQFSSINKTLIKHDHRFDELEQKIDPSVNGLRNEILTGFDEIMKALCRLEQESVSTVSWVRRIESKVEENTTDTRTIKRHLKLN